MVLVDLNKNEFSRKDVVIFLSNKDGGAHVDKNIEDEFAKIKFGNLMGRYSIGQESTEKIPGEDPLPATMR